MAKFYSGQQQDIEGQQHEADKQRVQRHQEQYHQMQRELADAITRLAPLDDIRILLAGGARVDGPVTQGLHPIHYAAYQNFVPAVRLLIVRGCDINAMDDNGYTPLHLASERGYYELLEFLIANGAKVCFTDTKKQSNLSDSVADEPLSLALKRGHLDCAELLVSWVGLFCKPTNSKSLKLLLASPLTRTTQTLHLFAIVKLKNGADPNARYFMGSEINLVSILKISSIKLLLEYGAQPDARDRSGLTPLMKAARHPQGYATVKLLIDYGADVNDIAGERHDYRTVLHHSIFSGNLDMIRLLLSSGARYPKLDFDKPSPMDIAIISGRHDIARLLIEFGADVNAGAQTTIGQPLHTALTQRIENKRDIVHLLLDSGSDPNSPKTSNRNTGPPLSDYLHSVRNFAVPNYPQQQQQQPQQQQQQQLPAQSRESRSVAPIAQVGGPDLEIIRLLLMYGAQVVLRPASEHPLGIVRTLDRLQFELTPSLLLMLIEAAEQIDWPATCRVIYECLRHATRRQSRELFEPHNSVDMTHEQVRGALMDMSSVANSDMCRILIKLALARQHSTLSLKQISRIKIRRHLADELGLAGHNLILRLRALPVPKLLRRYLLYQE